MKDLLSKISSVAAIVVMAILFTIELFGADDWCIEDPLNPPCGGAPGKCTVNKDYSWGGFVADTANVPKTRWGRARNKAFISRYAQICERASVLGEASVHGNARVYGNAHVSGRAWVWGNAQIYGDAQVYGRVFDDAQVSGNALVYGEVHGSVRVSGNARIDGDVLVQGNAQVREYYAWRTRNWHSAYVLTNIEYLPAFISPAEEVPVIQPISTRTTENLNLLELARQKLAEDKSLYSASCPTRNEILNQIRKLQNSLDHLDESLEKCPLCLETLQKQENLIFTSCHHFLCEDCFNKLNESTSCPQCRNDRYRIGSAKVKYSNND
jgi:hypothetical protein